MSRRTLLLGVISAGACFASGCLPETSTGTGSGNGGVGGTGAFGSGGSISGGSGDPCVEICTRLSGACANASATCASDCSDARMKDDANGCSAAFQTSVTCVLAANSASWCESTSKGSQFDDLETLTGCTTSAMRTFKGFCP